MHLDFTNQYDLVGVRYETRASGFAISNLALPSSFSPVRSAPVKMMVARFCDFRSKVALFSVLSIFVMNAYAETCMCACPVPFMAISVKKEERGEKGGGLSGVAAPSSSLAAAQRL